MTKDDVARVHVERHSANDDTYTLIKFLAAEGSAVRASDAIAVLEGSKAAFEVIAPRAGFIRHAAKAGEAIAVGALLAQIAADPKTPLQAETGASATAAANEASSRFTKKARALLGGRAVDLSAFEGLDIITEDDVKRAMKKTGAGAGSPLGDELTLAGRGKVERIAILGIGRGAIQVIDIVMRNKHQSVARFYDDHDGGQTLLGLGVSGPIDPRRILADYKAGLFDKMIVSVNVTTAIRAAIYDKLAALKIPFANAIHPSVCEGIGVSYGEGNVLCSNVSLGACVKLGNNNFISAHCNLEHHASLGSHNAFGPGVMTSGGVTIGSRIRFGMGIFIEPNLSIGDDATIASGAVITGDVPGDTLVKVHSNVSFRKRT